MKWKFNYSWMSFNHIIIIQPTKNPSSIQFSWLFPFKWISLIFFHSTTLTVPIQSSLKSSLRHCGNTFSSIYTQKTSQKKTKHSYLQWTISLIYIFFIYSLLWASSLVAVTQLKILQTYNSIYEWGQYSIHYILRQMSKFSVVFLQFLPLPFLFPSQIHTAVQCQRRHWIRQVH